MTNPTLIFGTLCEIVIIYISALLFLAKILTLIILCSPIYILRFIVSKLGALGPNLGNIITAVSTLYAIDLINTKPELGLLICAHLKGDSPDIVNYLRELVLNKVINVRNENGRLRNEQMQQYKYKWMGFLFWKWDENFDVSNHVNFYTSPEIENDSRISQAQLKKIESELLLKPFMKNKSPWEILVARNVESENGEPKSVVLFKIHHSVADGLSLMKLVFGALVQNETNSVEKFICKPKEIPQSRIYQFFKFCKISFLAPFQFAKYIIVSKDKSEWKPSEKITGRQIITARSEKLSLSDLKEIANFHQVGLTAVLYNGLGAGIRKSMLRKIGKVPRNIHFVGPAFIPGHPADKLTNHLGVVSCRIPVGIPESVERLKKQQECQDFLKDSAIPAFSFIMMGLLGALFPEMAKYFMGGSAATTTNFSAFPGPKEKVYIDGQEISDLYFYHGLTLTNFTMMVCSVTYSDGIRFTITADKSILENDEQMEELIYDIKEEFCSLKTGMYV